MPPSALIETGEEFTIDKRLVRPDGSTLWVGSSLSLIRRRADDRCMSRWSRSI
jgi:hypothetical protein